MQIIQLLPRILKCVKIITNQPNIIVRQSHQYYNNTSDYFSLWLACFNNN